MTPEHGSDGPMKVIVPVKRVPDTAGDKPLDPTTRTLNRDDVETVLNPVDEFSIEEACRLKEDHGAEVTVLLVGPETASQTVRKALSYGLDAAIQVTDDRIAGSDALATARVIAAAVRDEDFDVLLFGNQSTDARTCLVPAAVAELLGLPALTYARHLEIDGDRAVVHREHDEGWDVVEAPLPVVVSVVEAINDPRFPTFKGIMAAKNRPVDVRSIDGLDLDPDLVGAANSATHILEFSPRPPREPGRTVTDDGTGEVGATALADWLQEQKFI